MAIDASKFPWAGPTAVGTGVGSAVFQRRTVLAALLVFVGYYAGSQIGFALTFQPHPVSVLWPPNSILLAVLLLMPVRTWWLMLLAAFPAHVAAQVQNHIPMSMILCYFISNSCEALIGAGCVRYLISGPVRFDTLRSTAIFCLFGGVVGPFLSSFLDAGFVRMNHWGTGSYWEIWRIRLFSNILTALTFVPAIVTWFAARQGRPKYWGRRAYLEAGLVFAGLVGASYVAFYKEGALADPVWFYAPLPFLIWAALRLRARVTTTAILLITFLAIWSAAHGHGPFAAESPEENARSIQVFLVVMAIPFLFLVAGIEERRTAEERAEEAHLNLAHASRLAVVGELTASIAHEINQPLGAILSNADAAEMLLESDSPPLDELRKILSDIRNDVVRASETIHHIRVLTRKRQMQLELLEVNEVALEVMRLVATEARRRQVPMRMEFTAAPTTVLADRVHVQQVLMNLLLNAMEAMADTPEAERRLLVRTKTNGKDTVETSVTDSGRGIPPEKLQRLFESFFTTKESGMGLGLAIARSIIDAHHGQIFAENNPNGGATFRFDLPIHRTEVVSA